METLIEGLVAAVVSIATVAMLAAVVGRDDARRRRPTPMERQRELERQQRLKLASLVQPRRPVTADEQRVLDKARQYGAEVVE
jgi:F420-0:gamma-glutamyl ligase-like protein